MLLINPPVSPAQELPALMDLTMDLSLNHQEGIRGRLPALILAGASVSSSIIIIHNFYSVLSPPDGGVGGIQGGGVFAADLAQAQAQLQSLQQFRAAAGGHHQKMASFSFPNMLPNMMAANMMGLGLGGINLLHQQHQQFQTQLQQQANQPQRKSLFAPYLPQASLPPLLAAGKLVVGILRVNKRNRSDAYVATEVLDADIYICGSKDRNRALEGDIVAVELLDVDEVWGTKKEKEEKKRKKEENAAYDLKSTIGRKDDKKKDDVEVEGQGLMLFEDEE
jgi:protein SSD1